MKIKLLLLLLFLIFSVEMSAQMKPALSETDRVRLSEAFRLGETLGDKVWRNWSQAPFSVLLVTPEYEFLIRHPQPSKEFVSLGYDRLLKSEIYYRPQVFQTNLLATFPAVGGISTIVVGQAENTDKKDSTAWVLTLLHEHFHQLQTSQKDYYAAVDSLNLSRGDQTGMWMLNYDFPYNDEKIAQLVKKMAENLVALNKAERHAPKDANQEIENYFALRNELKATLSPDDYAYFSFQLWQEGIARYTEYKIAHVARNYKPSRGFKRLKDFQSFKSAEADLRENIFRELNSLSLPTWKRVAFYPLGAGEGLLLDRLNPGWRERYFAEKFYLEKYFEKEK